ncbi:MAG: GNAT family N-acetyltransferase [Candidatus Limnocylindrales bacterium]
MTDLEIRPMTAADIDAAVAMYQAGGWGERRRYLEWQFASPAMRLLVGVRDGAVVATGMAAINGPVGWIGSIFVDASMRSRGYGQALTEAACALIDAAGCRTQALIASPLGKPLYDKMGFRVDEYYQILEAVPLANAPTPPPGRILRPMRPEDLDRVHALDRQATGEDRSYILDSLAGSGWVVESEGELEGFLVSILPGGGTVVAPEIDDAVCLLDQLRHLGVGRTETFHAAVPQVHESGWRGLEQLGWNRSFLTPRMLRGPAIDWDPTLIWGVLTFAFG